MASHALYHDEWEGDLEEHPKATLSGAKFPLAALDIRQINLKGAALTNRLKELLSLRQFDLIAKRASGMMLVEGHLYINLLGQAGHSCAIADSILFLPVDMQGLFWTNISVVGGNGMFAGFPAHYGGAEFGRQPGFANVSVTRTEFLEAVNSACIRKFKNRGWKGKELGDEVPQGTGKEAGRSTVRIRGGNTQPQETDVGIEKQPLRSSRRAGNKG
ncbi:uncharacterized protein FOMMEDRAFT_170746 [Fomitiporia mediterranea MF3/22]|uniref:uncharacterized protein n=1 Tax=Fomitiporia mediterranea (strain MF3/22) TaxID=694068 RepID=UPI0004409087|nr:uncharacterized protein FOMMEDRAFT_170746 [Fomitiporia mediterranea MF3/22]EJC98953.1 hypothetical protein FOMMEDRAFT_170746 [Fomitiporia mediterranea MF3/22]